MKTSVRKLTYATFIHEAPGHLNGYSHADTVDHHGYLQIQRDILALAMYKATQQQGTCGPYWLGRSLSRPTTGDMRTLTVDED